LASVPLFFILPSLTRLYQGIKDSLRPDIVVSQFLRMPLDSYGKGVTFCLHRFYDPI
jgi:hypothetical protein